MILIYKSEFYLYTYPINANTERIRKLSHSKTLTSMPNFTEEQSHIFNALRETNIDEDSRKVLNGSQLKSRTGMNF